MWHVYSWFDGDNDGQPWEQTPLGSGIWKPRECPKPQSILVALLIADVAPPTIELLSRMHWQQSSGRSLESNSSKRSKGCVKGIQVYHTHKCIYVQYICIIYVYMFICIYVSMHLCIYVSSHLSIYLSIYLSTYPSIHPSIHLSLSIYHLSFIYLSIYESICISVSMCEVT